MAQNAELATTPAKVRSESSTIGSPLSYVQDMEMQLNEREASLVEAFRRLPPDALRSDWRNSRRTTGSTGPSPGPMKN